MSKFDLKPSPKPETERHYFTAEDYERHVVERLLQETKDMLDDVTGKYNEALRVNLELSKKCTESNEDYLQIAKEKELLEAKLAQAQANVKEPIKLKLRFGKEKESLRPAAVELQVDKESQ